MEESKFEPEFRGDKDQMEHIQEQIGNESQEDGAPRLANVGRMPQGRSKFFGYPKAWNYSIAAMYENMDRSNLPAQMRFHRVAINQVKRALGRACPHLTHVSDGKTVYFKARIKVGDKIKTINVTTDVETADQLSSDSYKELLNTLKNVIQAGSQGTV